MRRERHGKRYHAAAEEVRAGVSPKRRRYGRRHRRELEKKLFDEMGISKAWIGRRLVEIVERCTQKTPVLEWNPETRQKEPNGFWEFDANGAIRALHELAEHMDFAEGEQSAAESIEDWLARQEGSKL